MKFVVLQHVAWEHLGIFSELLNDLKLRAKVVRLDRGEKIPFREVREGKFSFVVSLGAPYTAYVPESNPHHLDEVEFFITIREEQVPSFNICYSMQLFSVANGGKVERNPRGKEVGLYEVHLTTEGKLDPVFGFAAPSFRTLQWHQDHVVELPKGSVRLAFSDKTQIQIAVTDGLHYLVQSDGQAAYTEMARVWMKKDSSFATKGKRNNLGELLVDLESNQAYFRDMSRTVLTNFTKLCVRK